MFGISEYLGQSAHKDDCRFAALNSGMDLKRSIIDRIKSIARAREVPSVNNDCNSITLFAIEISHVRLDFDHPLILGSVF